MLRLACAAMFAPAALAATPIPADAAALANAIAGRRIVLLGEVHDNAAQHALRLAALRILIDKGARPAIAFEQFDRERQPDIERARREHPHDAGYLVAQAKGSPGWNWDFYRPFVELALDYDLPIVAANLSRSEAMKIATAGAVTAEPVPTKVLRGHEDAIRNGHCDLLPAEALPAMAQAQIARDRTLASALRAHAKRGVVLLTGNGHARTDIGVPYWLTSDERAASISVGLLEAGGEEAPDQFDAYVVTVAAQRPDPCIELRRHMRPGLIASDPANAEQRKRRTALSLRWNRFTTSWRGLATASASIATRTASVLTFEVRSRRSCRRPSATLRGSSPTCPSD